MQGVDSISVACGPFFAHSPYCISLIHCAKFQILISKFNFQETSTVNQKSIFNIIKTFEIRKGCLVFTKMTKIMMLLGLNQAWSMGQAKVNVDIAERVVMTPYTAKRLAIMLAATLKAYEAKFGTIDIGVQTDASKAPAAKPAAKKA